jgi:hypothetical protein
VLEIVLFETPQLWSPRARSRPRSDFSHRSTSAPRPAESRAIPKQLTPPPMTTISKRSPKRRGPCPKVARNCRRKSWDRAKRLLRMARVILTRSSGEGERQEPTKINYAVRDARSPMLLGMAGDERMAVMRSRRDDARAGFVRAACAARPFLCTRESAEHATCSATVASSASRVCVSNFPT